MVIRRPDAAFAQGVQSWRRVQRDKNPPHPIPDNQNEILCLSAASSVELNAGANIPSR